MKKIIDPGDHLLESLARSGEAPLQYFLNDHRRELVKSAASRLFSKSDLEGLAPPPTHFGVHHVVMGSQEMYGPNRNGDGFPAATLQKYHPTFVTNGAVYRDHRHKSTDKKLGLIKAARYCPKIERVELVLHVCKKAAEREYEEAKAGKHHIFSMSAAMPWDECSCCQNRAKSAEAYCDHLRNDMLEYLPRFKKYAFAVNPIAKFFDDSFISTRQADRQAYSIQHMLGEADTALKKQASERGIIPGAVLGAALGIPDFDEVPMVPVSEIVKRAGFMTVLQELAAAEREIGYGWTKQASTIVHGISSAFDQDARLEFSQVDKLRALNAGTLFREMAKRAAFLPLTNFAEWVTGVPHGSDAAHDAVVKEAASCLPSIFQDLLSGDCECELPTDALSTFAPASSDLSCSMDPHNTDEVQKLMDFAEEKFSCKYAPMRDRSVVIVVTKSASARVPNLSTERVRVGDGAKLLATTYAVYKMAAVRSIRDACKDSIPNLAKFAVASHYPFFSR